MDSHPLVYRGGMETGDLYPFPTIRMYRMYKKLFVLYSQTCIKRSHLGQRKSGLTRQMTS
jgi:hypothetical protein